MNRLELVELEHRLERLLDEHSDHDQLMMYRENIRGIRGILRNMVAKIDRSNNE